MRIKAQIIAIIAIMVIIGAVLISNYGLEPAVDWSKPEAVAQLFMEEYTALGSTNFCHRIDKVVYGLLSSEAQNRLANEDLSLVNRLTKLSGGSPPPQSFEAFKFSERGDQAMVSFVWHYSSGFNLKKTVILVKRDTKWLIYSVVDYQE